jgi:hypothetical protein
MRKNARVDILAQLAILIAWIAAGLWVGRRNSQVGAAMLWMVVFGPLGLLLVAHGESRRGQLGPQTAAAAEPAQELDLPARVNVEGSWRDGVLHSWAMVGSDWHGWVSYSIDSAQDAGWFPQGQVQRFVTPDALSD